ncbi:MAG: hypothetical protein KIT36_15305 [Alphaproteobacteria bacterium]|nr:hypothetical protein [Alphaproteobacteria bacterium]
MRQLAKWIVPVMATVAFDGAAALAQPVAPTGGQVAFRARPTAVHVRACERAVLSKVRSDKNGAVTQLINDSVEEWQVTAAKSGVRGDGQYMLNNHWKHFRFSCLHSQSAGVIQLEYRNIDDIYSPASVPTRSPQGERIAFRRCESAMIDRVARDKNTRNVTVHADGADEWDIGPGQIGVRGYGTYPSSNEINSFRFHCTYDARAGRVVAVDYHKVY